MARNVAVVGGGYWGQNLVRNFAELGALHSICDSKPQNLSRLGQLYPSVKTEPDFNRILADDEIKGVVISTPAIFHYTMAKQALEAGKDVFVEKPLSLTLAEGQELVNLAQKTG